MLLRDSKFSKRQILLFLSDVIVLGVSPLAAFYIYFWIQLGPSFKIFMFNVHSLFFSLHNIVFLIVLYIFDQYDFQQDFRRKPAILRCALTVIVGGILVNFLSYLTAVPNQARGLFLIYCILIFIGLISVRFIYSYLGSVGLYDKRTLIIGCGDSGKTIFKRIKNRPALGLNIIGFLVKDGNNHDDTDLDVPVYYQKGFLKDEVIKYAPQLLIVAMRRERFHALNKDLIWLAQEGIEIWDVPTAYERLEKRIPIEYVDDLWLLFAAINRPKSTTMRLKRLLDISVSSVLLAITFPIMLLTIILIWIESRFPVILRQERIGQNGAMLQLYKFRSMEQCIPSDGEKGTCIGDNRVTNVGRLIRKLHIDELPQLFNVLKGDLSMVGPRAELFDFVYEYIENPFIFENLKKPLTNKATLNERTNTKDEESNGTFKEKVRKIIPYIEQRFTVPQGVTGWAQISKPYSSSSYQDMVEKIGYDLYYIKNMSIFLDIVILLKTVKIVLFGKGK